MYEEGLCFYVNVHCLHKFLFEGNVEHLLMHCVNVLLIFQLIIFYRKYRPLDINIFGILMTYYTANMNRLVSYDWLGFE